eukprot:4852969-Ditylum_brightwellii.AAC.1
MVQDGGRIRILLFHLVVSEHIADGVYLIKHVVEIFVRGGVKRNVAIVAERVAVIAAAGVSSSISGVPPADVIIFIIGMAVVVAIAVAIAISVSVVLVVVIGPIVVVSFSCLLYTSPSPRDPKTS